eukprot:GDKK01067245.1.p1 GENE.GDKK01067245.1~~GDKK01067245.1.p1  ORF type:complete len:913 (+),score=57.80 GDKK01067245.1:43-2739(+)
MSEDGLKFLYHDVRPFISHEILFDEESLVTVAQFIVQVGSLSLLNSILSSENVRREKDTLVELFSKENNGCTALWTLFNTNRSFGPQTFVILSKLFDLVPLKRKAFFVEELSCIAHPSVTAKLAASLPFQIFSLSPTVASEAYAKFPNKIVLPDPEATVDQGKAAAILWYGIVYTAFIDCYRRRPTFKRLNFRTPFLAMCPPHLVASLSQLFGMWQTHYVAQELITLAETQVSQQTVSIRSRIANTKTPPGPSPLLLMAFNSHPRHDSVYNNISVFENTWRVDLTYISKGTELPIDFAQIDKDGKKSKSSKIITVEALLTKLFAAISESCIDPPYTPDNNSLNIDDVCPSSVIPLGISDWINSIVMLMSRCGMTHGIINLRHGMQCLHGVKNESDSQKLIPSVSKTIFTKNAIQTACAYRRHEVLWLLTPETKWLASKDSNIVLAETCLENVNNHTDMTSAAASLKVLFQARCTITPSVIEFAKAHPDLIGLNYTTPNMKDTLLHIASINEREDVTEMLFSDKQFRVGLETNVFGFRAWDYCKNPLLLERMLKGAISVANRLFKSKEMMTANSVARSIIEKHKVDGLLDQSITPATAAKLHLLQMELKKASNPYLYDKSDTTTYPGSNEIIESLIRSYLPSELDLAENLIRCIREAIEPRSGDNFNTLSLTDGKGGRLVNFGLAIVSVRYALESVASTSMTTFMQTLLEGGSSKVRISEDERVESGIPITIVNVLRELGLVVELEDAFGTKGFHVERAVIVRIAMPRGQAAQILYESIQKKNNEALTAHQKGVMSTTMLQKKPYETRFVSDWELLDITPTQRARILLSTIADALNGLAEIKNLSDVLASDKPFAQSLFEKPDAKLQNIAFTPLYYGTNIKQSEADSTVNMSTDKHVPI